MDFSGLKGGVKHVTQIADTNEEFECAEGKSILGAMVALGRKGITSGCHGGGCGVCKVQILKGVVKTENMSRAHVSSDEAASGVVLACKAYPQSAVVLTVTGQLHKNIVRGANLNSSK